MELKIPDTQDGSVLHHCTLPCGRVLIWDTGEWVEPRHKSPKLIGFDRPKLGYAYWHGTDEVPMFMGDDFSVPQMRKNDISAVQDLLGFLSLRKGDTDDEYFEKYTPRQLAWRDEHAEELGSYADQEDYLK